MKLVQQYRLATGQEGRLNQEKYIAWLEGIVIQQGDWKSLCAEYASADMEPAREVDEKGDVCAWYKCDCPQCEKFYAMSGEVATNQGTPHPEAFCQNCHRSNPSWSAPSWLWNKVNGSPNGILCPSCFQEKCDLLGINIHFTTDDLITPNALTPEAGATTTEGEIPEKAWLNLQRMFEESDFMNWKSDNLVRVVKSWINTPAVTDSIFPLSPKATEPTEEEIRNEFEDWYIRRGMGHMHNERIVWQEAIAWYRSRMEDRR